MRTILTKEQFYELRDALDRGDDDELRPDYSGRGMYGKTCLGYVGEHPTRFVMALAKIVAERDEDDEVDEYALADAVDDLGEPVTDSMGRSTIYYYTGIGVEGAEEIQDELDEEE